MPMLEMFTEARGVAVVGASTSPEKLGYQVLELPIYFEDRRIGRSKMNMPIKLEAALRTWQIRYRHRSALRRVEPEARV